MMQIESLIIYGKNGKVRKLNFNLGSVNIITGISKTGKTSISQIIEYCLGSKSCEISAGVVRRYVSWFALLLNINDKKCFVARKNPDFDKKYCNAMYYEIANSIQIPESVNWITNIDNFEFIKVISSQLGIEENIHFVKNNTRDDLSANIKHALFYCIQNQYEIANPTFIFHKESEDFVKQAIKDTMPYFLGIVDKQQILIKQELQELKRKLLIIERKEKEKNSIDGGKTRALQLLNEAEQVGLIDASMYDNEDDIETLINLIRKIEKTEIKTISQHYTSEDELTKNQNELNDMYSQMTILNQKITDVKNVIKLSSSFADEKLEQKKRLESLNLFDKLTFEENKCPFCSQSVDSMYPSVISLKKSLVDLDNNLANLNTNELPLNNYLKSLINDKKNLNNKINFVENKIQAIQNELEDIEKYKDLSVRQGKIIGRISLWLESYKEEPANDKEKQRIIEQIFEKEQLLSDDNINEQLDCVMNIISKDITKWAKEMDLEYQDSQYRFSQYSMTVFVDTEKEGAIPLKGLGSGANWVGIHLLVYFAFQKYFIKKQRPIPNFILLDQPSQIYFPNNKNTIDWNSVKKIYSFIQRRVKELEGKLQVIVVDHADFSDDEDFIKSTIENWSEGNALIPPEWKK